MDEDSIEYITKKCLALEESYEELNRDLDDVNLRLGNLVSKHDRLLYIAGQLGMLKRDTQEFKELWAEFTEMKYGEVSRLASKMLDN